MSTIVSRSRDLDAQPDPGAQDEVLDFLSNPKHYKPPIASVGRIDTHCSSVFLVDDRAYKLKRAIRFASLDYGTAALRERACRAELRLNARTTPRLYLGVAAITREAGGELAFDGAGPAVDWVVVMRRVHQEDLFDRMAEAGQLSIGLVQMLSRSAADFHAAVEIAEGGGASVLRKAVETNRAELTRAGFDDREVVAPLLGRTLAELGRLSALLERRRDDGHIRRCHGDLRLANVCLFEGRPAMFDAIEFSDEISCIDTMYDFAFLLMDLRQRGMEAHAKAALNAYLARSGDLQALPALPLFMSVRAATRAYALAGKARRSADQAAASRCGREARRHLDFAVRVIAEPPPEVEQ